MPDNKPYPAHTHKCAELDHHRCSCAQPDEERCVVDQVIAMVEEGRPTAEITAMWDRRWPGRSQVDTWHGWPTDEDYDRESRHAG